jgi:HK97 family phage major capsid protein
MTVKVPTTPDGLQEVLTNAARMKEIFSDPEALKEFMGLYAAQWAKKNSGTSGAVTDLRDQVQSVLFDMVRDAGGGRKPGVNIGALLQNGRPTLSIDGTAAIAKGKGALYNKASAGAEFERAYGNDEDRFGSVGEYCQAIRAEAVPGTQRNRTELLHKLSVVRSFQDSFGSEDPGAGGFLIPEIMRSELLQLALEESLVRSRATVIPMSTLRVPIPSVDDTSHASSLFGGIIFYWAEESASLTESQAAFGRVVLDAKKLTGFFKVPNELLADAPAFSGWFDSRVPMGLSWWEDVAFLTETGAGTPMGVVGLNNPAYVAVDRATENEIAYADLVGMYARMLPTSLKNAVWIANIDTFPQIAQLALSSSAPGVWMGGFAAADASDAPPVSLFGRPIFFT